jgi:uncharacterized protein (DUF885 family)
MVLAVVLAGQSLLAGDSRLHGLFDEAWEYQLLEDPLFATAVGRHDYDDRLPAMSRADHSRRAAHWQEILDRLEVIEPAGLAAEDRLNRDLFERQVHDRILGFEFKTHLIPITAETGFHTDFARLPSEMPLATVRDYDNYIARLRAFPNYVEQHIELMRRGIEEGFVLPRVVLTGYGSTIEPHVVEAVDRSVFWQPFVSLPNSVAEGERRRLVEAGRKAVLESVVPAYARFLRFMKDKYIPKARASLGAAELPGGREYYAHLIRHYTTLDLTADEVHRIGLDEVKRIRGEMLEILHEVEYEGDLEAFLEFLRADPRFYAETAEELLKEAAYIAKRMDGKLPALFKTLPRLPYAVAPVPEHLAPKYTAGRYVEAPLGSAQPGTYWVNTYALESRPLYALTALTLHEAVPGHHLQNALRQELEDLPEFRRFSGIDAYGEGWGLYAEWLGLEAGLYDDPYDHFGRLTYEMWRAGRLVVDTGLHAMGWSRQRVMEYLAANTALSRHEITTETDRYISWPGQALAYKLGELKIRQLRKEAESALGARFDVREFHDVVLLNGPVPLPVLEDQVRAYIGRRGEAAG